MYFFSYSPGIYREMVGTGSREAYIGQLLDGDGPYTSNIILLKMQGIIPNPPAERPTALLVLDGVAWIATNKERYDLHQGRGAICVPGEPYSMGTLNGALLLAFEASQIRVHPDCQMITAEQLKLKPR